MRATLVVAALVLATLPALPAVSAVGWCVEVGPVHKDNVGGGDCDGNVCTGYHGGQGGSGTWDDCYQLASVRDPCDMIACNCTCPPVTSQPRYVATPEVIA